MVCNNNNCLGLLLKISIKFKIRTQHFNKAADSIKYVRVSILLTCGRHVCMSAPFH